jgi:signal peptidase
MRKIVKIATNLFYGLFIAAIVVFGAAFVLSVFGKEGTYQLLVVESGSMKPNINIGSVLLIQPASQARKSASPIPAPTFNKGDIVTYLSGDNPITHRVVGVEDSNSQFTYQTKGDANRTPDQGKVSEKQILGKTILVVPFIGHAVNFAKTQMGYIFLIVVPITLIIYSEILAISSEIRKIFAQRRRRREAI